MSDIFLEINGPDIKGECTVDGYKDQIDIDSWSWGASNMAELTKGGGSRSGGANFGEVTLNKVIDGASPNLLDMLAKGKHFEKMTLTNTRVGGADEKPIDYFKIIMEKVFITGVSLSGMAGEVSESMNLSFAKYTYEYAPMDAAGKKGAIIKKGYDIAERKAA
jgi:type VI secretion system secreted protein Hcp